LHSLFAFCGFVRSGARCEENLSFLTRFIDEDCRLFTEQIQFDLGYSQKGAALLEKAMTAIQGRVEIEQAESDRTTQNLLRQKEESDQVRDRSLILIVRSVLVPTAQAEFANQFVDRDFGCN
jgi:hypothetical protein